MKNNTNTITEEELKELKRKAFDALSHSRHVLLNKYPFIGSIALRMELVPVRDLRVRTACTDGNSVYFDIAFLSSLSNEERIFVLAHEIWHAVLLHLTRRGNRNPLVFNVATDKEVNYMLNEDGLTPPPQLCFPEGKEVGKCAEEIYEMMLNDMKKKNGKNQKQQQNSNGSSNSSDPSSSNGNGKSKKNRPNNCQGDNGQKNNSQKGSGNPNGEFKGQFDKHIYDGDEPEGQKNSSNGNSNSSNGGQPNENGEDGNSGSNGFTSQVMDKYGEVGYDSDFQPQIPKGFADRMRETVISEAQRVEKMRGTIPSHIKELVKRMTNAELDWKELLAQFVTRCYNSGNRSWIPPNRRHVHNNVYLQSRQATKIKICVGIDTSGSTSGDRSKFLGELNGLIKSFGHFDLHIIECDSEVGAYKHYTQDDNLDSDLENGEYAMSGGGGTAMKPIFDYIIDNNIECDAIAIMTDGYIDHIEKNPIPSMPVLWIITKDGTEDFCDWGQKIKLTHNDEDL